MKSFKHIFIIFLAITAASYSAEQVGSAQTSQIVKGVAKKAGKILRKKAAKESAEGVGKKAAKEAAEAAGKSAAKENFQEISKELAERAARENAGKLLARSAGRDLSEKAIREIGEGQVTKEFAQNVMRQVGKDAPKLFKESAAEMVMKSSEEVGEHFAKKLGTKEAKESAEQAAQKMLSRAQEAKAAERQGMKKRFESTLLSSKVKKSALYKELMEIIAKGPFTLTEKEFAELIANPNYLRSFILAKTGDKKLFQEFFIRLAMGNKEQARAIMEIPWVRDYLKKAIRAGGVHEWLMTKNFQDFLLNPKWGDDGAYLALALTKFVQNTRKINFRPKSIYGSGGHPSSGRQNSAASAKWHKDLAELISRCNSKEELFMAIKRFAKETLTEESYREFKRVFADVFKASV